MGPGRFSAWGLTWDISIKVFAIYQEDSLLKGSAHNPEKEEKVTLPQHCKPHTPQGKQQPESSVLLGGHTGCETSTTPGFCWVSRWGVL